MSLTEEIKRFALDIGYSKVGITDASDFVEYREDVLSRGDSLAWFRDGAAEPLRYADPKEVLPGAKSIIVLAYDYAQNAFPEMLLPLLGRVYMSRSYNAPPHRINGMRRKLMEDFLREKGCQVGPKRYQPARWAAMRAGVAGIGKNNFAYVDGIGSFVVLDTITVDVELACDAPTTDPICGTSCRRCIDACPTKALHAPYRLDSRRCLGYLAWTTQGVNGISPYIPRDLRPLMGTHIHGCDICQEVCPKNKKRLKMALPEDPYLQLLAKNLSLEKLLFLDDEYYERWVEPVMYNYIRNKSVFRRNAAIALGNRKDPDTVPCLEKALGDEEPLVRAHVAWALGQIGTETAKRALEEALLREEDVTVREEIAFALASNMDDPA